MSTSLNERRALDMAPNNLEAEPGSLVFTFDSGWTCQTGCRHGRGWCSQERTIRLHPKMPLHVLNKWLDDEQRAWRGQQFGHSLTREGELHLTRSVDSGD